MARIKTLIAYNYKRRVALCVHTAHKGVRASLSYLVDWIFNFADGNTQRPIF